MKKFLLAFAAVLFLFGMAVNAAYPEMPKETISVTIRERETLWDIAEAHAPRGTDIRKYVYRIRKLNGITNPGAIQTGQVILLPKGDE